MSEELNEIELDDLNRVITNTLNSLIDVADKHNIDRNSFIQYFSALFGKMVELCTFENYKKGGST